MFLVRFLPAKCPAHVSCSEVAEECGESTATNSNASGKNKDRELDWGYWQAAWPRYSLSAVATNQMTMAQCQHHAVIVLDVASLAHSHGRTAWLGVFYDKIAR